MFTFSPKFFGVVQALNRAGLVQAYHDRSDGGLIITLCEMAFAAHCGLEISISVSLEDLNAFLFTEEPGAVIQVDENHFADVMVMLGLAGLENIVHDLGRPVPGAPAPNADDDPPRHDRNNL